MQIGAAMMENCAEIPQKIRNGTTVWPSDSTSQYLSEETQTLIWKIVCTPKFIAVLYTMGKSGRLSFNVKFTPSRLSDIGPGERYGIGWDGPE